VVAKSDSDWKAFNEVLRRLKAKPNCSGNQLIKAFVPCQNGLFHCVLAVTAKENDVKSILTENVADFEHYNFVTVTNPFV
jgi:hypothetical protein